MRRIPETEQDMINAAKYAHELLVQPVNALEQQLMALEPLAGKDFFDLKLIKRFYSDLSKICGASRCLQHYGHFVDIIKSSSHHEYEALVALESALKDGIYKLESHEFVKQEVMEIVKFTMIIKTEIDNSGYLEKSLRKADLA